tara:strand:+ start:264 stop:524 length:261 start_codon:yes stop_codon:yes gene_type:complete
MTKLTVDDLGYMHEGMANVDEMLEDLERLVDKHGMAKIMFGLVHITDDKAEHVQCNWHDLVLADAWRKVSDALISKRLSNALNRLP